MERCELLKKFDEGDYQELLKNLGILHSYFIIHMDISPPNIMFSKTHGKLIFIDFGLS
jgi:tRNA A-37 threonylcarbamoyl transferase component Bud32